MQDMNIVAISGRLTRDAELRQLPNGNSLTRLRIASNDRIKRGDQWEDTAYFFDVTVFGKQGENVARYLGKGDPIMVEGKLHWSEWEKDGQTNQRVDITANRCIFFPKNSGGSKGDRDEGSSGSGSTTYGGRQPAADDDDIPF